MTGPFEGAHVLVVGDVMLDEHLRGDVRRISPEAPVPVVELHERGEHLGGAANVAQVVLAMGARATLVGVVGDDPAGDAVIRLAAAAGIVPRLVRAVGRVTTVKTRVIARQQQICRVDQETRVPVDEDVADRLAAVVEAVLDDVDAVVVSDYGKGVLTDPLLQVVIRAAAERSIPVVVDPTTGDVGRYAGVTVVKPNRSELLGLAGLPADGDVIEAAERVLTSIAPSALVVTLGADGLAVLDGVTTTTLVADSHPVYDVTGAGDTVAAVLALGLAVGQDVVEAAGLANRAAALSVTKPGTTPVTIDELVGNG